MYGACIVVAHTVVEVEPMSDLPVVLPIEGKGVYEYLPLWIDEDDARSRWVEASREEVRQEQDIRWRACWGRRPLVLCR